MRRDVLTLMDAPASAVRFEHYEDFLTLTEEGMRQVVKAVCRAQIDTLFRLFGSHFGKDGPAKKYGSALVARILVAVGSDVARVTPAGRMEFDVHMDDVAMFANILVQNKVDEAYPIIDEVICNLMNELRFLATESESSQ